MNDNYTFRTEQVKFLPSEIYDKIWYWLFKLRQRRARAKKMKEYLRIRSLTPQPHLYKEE